MKEVYHRVVDSLMKCSICGAIMRGIHETHNPEPIKPCEERCCGDCNSLKVIPARLALMGYKLDPDDHAEENARDKSLAEQEDNGGAK